MRKRHRLVLVGGFSEEEVRQTFKRRGVRFHSHLVTNEVDGYQEGIICFNPERIKPSTVIQLLTKNRDIHSNVALVAMEDNHGEACHDCQQMVA